MKKKLVIFAIIFALLLISIVVANSSVQAFSREEKWQVKKQILEQKVEDNKITEEEASQIYRNIEERMANCDNICEPYENCPIYQQNSNCMKQNNQCSQKNYDNIRNCGKRQNCHNR